MARPRPLLVLLFSSGGLLLWGCAAPASHEAGPVTDTPAASHAAPVPALPAARAAAGVVDRKPFGLAWESYVTVPGEVTGIESSTNLIHWKLEAEWPIVTESNIWHDTNFAPAKFYRAFNRAP
jgi:hypothetical protein